MGMRMEWIRLAQDNVMEGCHLHNNEHSDVIIGHYFLEKLSDYQPFHNR
jgi:hypothetical protein